MTWSCDSRCAARSLEWDGQLQLAAAWPSQLIGLFPSAGFVVTTRPGALDVTGCSGITGMVQLQEVASGLLWGL
jgi:hypothetical protein